jgi:hypothetical protein
MGAGGASLRSGCVSFNIWSQSPLPTSNIAEKNLTIHEFGFWIFARFSSISRPVAMFMAFLTETLSHAVPLSSGT